MADPAVFLDLLARAELRSASGDWAEAAELWARVTEANPVHGDYWARLAEARYAGPARHRPALERRRQHLPLPGAAAPPDPDPADQPARHAVRHHRSADVLGRAEHRDRDRP